jgi:hypothetical protein
MPNLNRHHTNHERLWLANELMHERSPGLKAREQLQHAIKVLESAQPGLGQSDREACGVCRRAASGLRKLLHTPPARRW